MQSYWDRVADLAALLTPDAQEQMRRRAGEVKVPKRLRRRLEEAIASSSGTATYESVDATALRYALWTVRRKFDWKPKALFRGVPEIYPRVDRDICNGIWDLDVTLRRQVEALVIGAANSHRARELRAQVEEAAGALAASLDIGRSLGSQLDYWPEIADKFDNVCNELNELLTEAGAPRPQPRQHKR